MIKVYNIWGDNFKNFVDDVLQNIDKLSMVILDCLNEVEYNIQWDSNNLTRLLEVTNQYKIPVKFLTPNNQKHIFPYENVEIIVWQAFWFFRTLRTWSFEHNKQINDRKGIDPLNMSVCRDFDIKYPYICLNNIVKHHRSTCMDILAKHDLIKYGKISWRDVDRSQIKSNFIYKYWEPKKLILDQDTDVQFVQETMPYEFNNSFMQLVTESDDVTTFFSEKTATPLLLNKPFLVLSNPGFHRDLQELGFELYDELFDYSFDGESDLEKRTEMLISNLKRYIHLTPTELKQKYDEVFPKLIRNKKLALKYAMTIPKKIRELQKQLEEKNVDYHGPLNNTRHQRDYVMKKVAMIGVGKLGQDCAEVMAAYNDVVGYDIEPRDPAFPMMPTIAEAVKGRDLIFIAAPTPHDPIYGGETPTSHLPNKDFDYTIVTDILKEVNKHVTPNQLVVLISTVLPGTVRSILRPCITNCRFIYNPYLIAMGTIKWDMVNPEMVIIGTEDGSLTGDANELIDFYRVFMQNNPRYEVGTWDEAEAIKIFYNTFISTKLALVNMIQDVAETNGNMNVDVVTNALAKSTYRIMGPMYMKAALGDAGACHPRDNIALRYLAERLDLGYDLFDSIMTAREKQAERMALACLKHGKNVTIVGKAYKPCVPYTNGSASMLVGHYIEKHGGNLNYYDENTGDLDLKTDWTDVYLIGYWQDYVATLQFNTNATVIDPWRKMTNEQFTGSIIHYGNTRK